VAVGAVLAGVFLLALPRRYALAVPLVVLAYLAVASKPVHEITEQASHDNSHAGISIRKDWIDRAVGTNGNVSILFFAVDAVPFWQNEFFNASVKTVYNVNGNYDGLAQTQVGVDPKTQVLVDPTHNRFVHAPYLLVNQSVFPRGRLVAEDPGTGMRLFRTSGRYVHIPQIVGGLYPDTWSGQTVGYQRYGCKGGKLLVTLTSDPAIHPTRQVVSATEANREVARRVITPANDVGQTMVVPLRSQDGLCGVEFTITPTAVPNDVIKNGDLRQLGIRFARMTYRPTG
jgi:hypothetical protein